MRSMDRSKYISVPTTLGAIAGILLFAGQLARLAEAAVPARVSPGAPYPWGVAVPFPHPTSTFSRTPTATPTPLLSPTPTPTATWGPSVSIVPIPSSGALNGVAALSANDMWAVGQNSILHWDGSAWSASSFQSVALYGIAAISANDLWAVGDYGDGLN